MFETINERLKKYRRLAGYTQNELAEKLGMNGSTYSQMERVGNNPAQRLLQVAEVLGIEPILLLEGEKPFIPVEPESPVIKIAEPIDIIEPDPFDILSQKEKNLIKIFRNLPQAKKNELYNIIKEIEKK